jgi:hypothetical protein
LDTLLGLSMTSTSVGWVLVEGHDADGTILDHDEFEVRTGGGARAVKTAKRVTAELLRVQAAAVASDHPVRVIGATWSDDAAAEAALALESLTGAGCDNVVPVQSLQAVETLARAITPVIGYEQSAVCVLEHDSATVAIVDTCGGETRTAVRQVRDGHAGLVRWLTAMFQRGKWQPAGVVVVGSGDELDAISRQLEKALPVPVLTQSDPQLAVARGAAMAAAQSTEFTDARLLGAVANHSAAPVRSRPLSYAAALTMLATGAVTLVASLALAVGLRLTPEKSPGAVERAVHPSVPHIAKAVAPPVPPPAEVKAPATKAAVQPVPPTVPPVAAPAVQPEPDPPHAPPASVGAPEPITPPQEQPSPPPPPPPPPEPDPHPLLTRILQRIHGGRQDVPPQEPAPAEAPPAPPPNPGAPSP